ncbi:MAG: bifunctional [glutamate--ammonia ligase]-adenylyl-L-tyrosine phosphorylase/[glutamate--ammonia-ligase] adenylyltransferase [Sulfuricellaceae bacterium]|nr:bifunctional [glutamate--ammonia ligase]-adenylyl-L-tyrosine phosphorylase/[glutamate--ammonia-ligase] adenylyltransferase [Sulfuricellaceae bacterium]
MSIDNSQDNCLISTALKYSRYAQRLVQGDPALYEDLIANLHVAWDAPTMEAALAASEIPDENSLKTALRTLRKRVMLRLIIRDLSGLSNLDEVMRNVTELAEVTITASLKYLSVWLAGIYGEAIGEQSHSVQDLIVIGMGKLGGGELNVSSDIDLIFAYNEEGETSGPKHISNHEYFVMLGKKLIASLNDNTQDGFVFRVDMRLRPYGDSGPLAGSFSMLENYYLTQGREWERYAWIKGRPLCGKAYQELAAILKPFVFRKYLDFGAFSSMRELHAQIRQEVQRKDMNDNIKLGPGGIREIEFIAQVFQLIRGGKDIKLQTRSTRVALDLIEERGLMPVESIHELRNAYTFLRNLEHRLQYLDDTQTQTLPTNDGDRQLIAEALKFSSWDDFYSTLTKHRQKVTGSFEQVFSAPHSQQQNHSLNVLWKGAIEQEDALAILHQLGFKNTEKTWNLLTRLRQGNRYAQMPESSRKRFDSLLPPLIQVTASHTNPDETLERVIQILESIARRASYLALLLEYPQTLKQLAKLCSASPWVTTYLAQHPILLDELLDPRRLQEPLSMEKARSELRDMLNSMEGDTEQQMDMLRHFKQAQQFRLVSQDLSGLLKIEDLSDSLSGLADILLEEIIRLCWQGLRTRHRESPQFAIIGYGKLGGKELGYASDLDIIYLYEDDAPEAPEIYARLGQRINTWLTSVTPAGMLYETDLRLRPNGASGLLVSSIEAFDIYQRTMAWTWEHQAISRARFCAGTPEIGRKFDQIRCNILKQQRDITKLKHDVREMRQKMLDSHPNNTQTFDLKHDRGGIIDVEFAVQYLVLAHANAHEIMTKNAGNLALLKYAAQSGLIADEISENARIAYRHFRQVQHTLRLQGCEYARIVPEDIRGEQQSVIKLWNTVIETSTCIS